MRRCIFSALLIALTVATSEATAVSYSISLSPDNGVTAGDLPGDIPAGTLLAVYEFFLHSDSAAKVTEFDLTFTGEFAHVQLASFGSNYPTPLLQDLASFPQFAIDQDTHFVPSLIIPDGSEPSEPSLTIGQAGAGYASGLSSGPVTIAGAEQAPSVLIAQIVAQSYGQWDFFGWVKIEGIPRSYHMGGIPWPEPGTFWLASMGIIGLMTSRCRSVGYSDSR